MNIQLTTKHQDWVLSILYNGGKIQSFISDESRGKTWPLYHNVLSDLYLNDYVIKSNTIKKLEELGFIKLFSDKPALYIDTYEITELGKHWVKDNHLQSINSKK